MPQFEGDTPGALRTNGNDRASRVRRAADKWPPLTPAQYRILTPLFAGRLRIAQERAA